MSDLLVITIIIWYFLNGIKSNLEKIAEELKEMNLARTLKNIQKSKEKIK